MEEETEDRIAGAFEDVAESLEYIVGTQVELLDGVSQILAGQEAAQPALAVIEDGAAKAEFEKAYNARRAQDRPWWNNRTIQIVAAAIIAVAALITGVAKADMVGEVVAVVVDVESQA